MNGVSARSRRGLERPSPDDAAVIAAFTGLLLFGGCGGGGEPMATGGAPVPLADVPASYARAICDLYTRCLGPTFVRIFFGSEDCSTLTERRFSSTDFHKLEQAVESGVVEYDGTLVAACLASLAERGCDLEQRSNPTCQGVFKGTVPLGGECEIDEVCQGDRICSFDGACPGTCIARKAAGVSCTRNEECESALVCHTETRLCVQPAAEGDACEGGDEAQCKAGLWCNGSADGVSGTCMTTSQVQAAAEGAPCNVITATRELCREGLVCAVQAVSEQMPVFQCKVANATPGGTCSLAFPEDCPAGEYCPLTEADLAAGTFAAECAPLPGVGEPCLPAGRAGQRCAAFTRCSTDGRCAALRENGETCESDDFCYSGFCVGGGCKPSAFCD